MRKCVTALLTAILICAFVPMLSKAAEKPTLDVFTMTEIPAGTYDVQLEDAGKKATVKLEIRANRAKFVKSSLPKFEGLGGSFELLGNGVFVARLSSKGGNTTQLWLFQPDGTAKVKENPDRGEKQIAKLVSAQ